jgi:hypothetical protein
MERAVPLSGGLALDLAVAHALRLHRDADLDCVRAEGDLPPRPVFVVLTRMARAPSLELGLSETWADLVPCFEIHALCPDGSFTPLRRGDAPATPLLRVGASRRPLVAGRGICLLPATSAAGLEFWSPASLAWLPVADAVEVPASGAWARAVSLQIQQQNHDRSPGDGDVDLAQLVKSSRASGILLPSTSYIVVENEAQWRMLAQAEGTKLGQNAALDFLETPAPPGLVIALAFGLWLGLRWLRSDRRRAPGNCA